jgi:hypothetical protein
MSPRSIRRAAERKAQKLARKAAQQNTEISEARLVANRANAQLSTGPTSPDGKSKSSLNAVKTGLTGRTVLLPTDDAAAYQQFIQNFFAEWNPATDAEHALVQSLADTQWRLNRIPSLEMGLYALGRLEFANHFDDHDPTLRPALIEAHTYLAYHRQLNNLSIQESRLRRQREKDTAALKQLQSERHSRETASRPKPAATHTVTPTNGFEFSTLNESAWPGTDSPHSGSRSDAETGHTLAERCCELGV